MPPSRLLLLVLAALCLVAAGCAAPPNVLAPADGHGAEALLARPDLQRLVERQARRDSVALVAALRDPDPVVRARAALGLASVQAPSAVPALLPLLDDPDPTVRAHAAFALGQTPHDATSGPLLDALRAETDTTTLRLLLFALGQTGHRATLAALVGIPLPAELEPERALAIARFGMRDLHDPTAVAWLAARLRAPDPRLRHHAAYYVGRMPSTTPWIDHAAAVRDATAALDPSDPAQLHLALALGRLGEVELLRRLLTESTDWRIRTQAARALGMPAAVPSAQAQALLLEALNDPSPHVAAAAAGALGAAAHLESDTVEHLAAYVRRAEPNRWYGWAVALQALARAGRADAVFAGLARLPDDPYARAQGTAALGLLETRPALARLADLTTDPDVRVATAALQALRARWERHRRDEEAPVYLEAFAEALHRADAATAEAAVTALRDSTFLALGAGDLLRQAYAQMEAPRDLAAMLGVLRAQADERSQDALDFLLRQGMEAPHPVLRQAATQALDARFGEGIAFASVGGGLPPTPALDWERLRRLGPSPRLVLETERGTITLALRPDLAPLTVQMITRFAERGDYDGVPFHRVVPGFVAQGGDFVRGDGLGRPDYVLPSEFTPLPFHAGVLGMASAGKDTEGSQFFLMHALHPHLDGRYTAFGRVEAGQEVLDTLVVGDRILRARVLPTGSSTPRR